MVFIDPPYNVPIAGHVSGLGGTQHREFVMASGEMPGEEFVEFLRQSLSLLAKHSRSGSIHANMQVHFPLRDDGINRAGVIETLDSAGLGEPEYYRWRTRSGCTFCFFQQKIEWVRLMREHPDAFDEAKGYEKTARDHGSPFTWSQGEGLDQLSAPARVEEIEREFEQRRARLLARRRANPLAGNQAPTIDDVYGIDEASAGCVICRK